MRDRTTVRTIAIGLMMLGIVVVVGLLLVVVFAHDIPANARVTALATVGAIGTTAVGAGASLLASTRTEADVPPAGLDDLLPPPAAA